MSEGDEGFEGEGGAWADGDRNNLDAKQARSEALERLDERWEIGDRELWRAYHRLQFDRIEQHENSRLQASNFVTAGSLVALGLVIGGRSQRLPGVAFASAVLIVNILAALWHLLSRRWVRLSRAKADTILRNLDPGLWKLQRDVNRAERANPDVAKHNPLLRMQTLLASVHAILAAVAAVLLIAQL